MWIKPPFLYDMIVIYPPLNNQIQDKDPPRIRMDTVSWLNPIGGSEMQLDAACHGWTVGVQVFQNQWNGWN